MREISSHFKTLISPRLGFGLWAPQKGPFTQSIQNNSSILFESPSHFFGISLKGMRNLTMAF